MIINPYIFAGVAPIGFPSGLSLWARYKADMQAEAEGVLVTQLTDQSGNGRHGTFIYKATMRTNAVNGKKAFDFTPGGGSRYNLPSMTALTEVEIFHILKTDLDNQTNGFRNGLHKFGTAGDVVHYKFSDGLGGAVYDSVGRAARYSFALADVNTTNWHLYNVSAKNLDSKNYVNNVLKRNDTVSGVPTFPATPHIGGYTGNFTTYFFGRIAETVILSVKATAPQRAALHAYFNDEYNLTIV